MVGGGRGYNVTSLKERANAMGDDSSDSGDLSLSCSVSSFESEIGSFRAGR